MASYLKQQKANANCKLLSDYLSSTNLSFPKIITAVLLMSGQEYIVIVRERDRERERKRKANRRQVLKCLEDKG